MHTHAGLVAGNHGEGSKGSVHGAFSIIVTNRILLVSILSAL